ncbi:hypothetical protein PGT21_035316 [Puccinia graminis f. sp. tritici]|uniref:DUF171-domain-containing protein n=1 Tax=Puccinia graminis f. sp. tritici TaxID=56615 RepID=A0A5B0MRA7_PUCGR|nr:hypothetical protein PGT21_035316 [Puccinia graminis f. sp. tritici]
MENECSTANKKRRRKSSGKCKAAMKELVRESMARLVSQTSEPSDEPDQPVEEEQATPGIKPKLSSSDHSNCIQANLTGDQLTGTAQNPTAQNLTAEFARIHKPHKPSANVTPSSTKGRQYTVSIALPGSIVNNAQTWELKTALVGQIARACAIFSVNEIIIFDESVGEADPSAKPHQPSSTYGRAKYRTPAEDLELAGPEDGPFQPSHFVARILEYLECPQYLRKSLFPIHPDLRLAGLLPPLDLPHHFRKDHETPWREGCILPADKVENYVAGGHYQKKKHRKGDDRKTSWADVGLAEPVQVQLDEGVSLPDWTRVTVQMPKGEGKLARLVSPRLPTQTTGIYWGYSIRLASSISKVFTETPYASEGGYDLTIGTSERGENVDDVVDGIGDFKHMLLVLGGLSGLELTIASDDTLEPRLTAADAPLLFDHWLNTLPFQGSRTVRTEEALLVSLGALRRLLFRS